MCEDYHISHYLQYKHINTTMKQSTNPSRINYNHDIHDILNLTVMIMNYFHNNIPIHFTIVKNLQIIGLKFAFRSMIDRSGFDRSDRSFSRIV